TSKMMGQGGGRELSAAKCSVAVVGPSYSLSPWSGKNGACRVPAIFTRKQADIETATARWSSVAAPRHLATRGMTSGCGPASRSGPAQREPAKGCGPRCCGPYLVPEDVWSLIFNRPL